VLSNDNDVAIGATSMEVVEEITMTPTVKQATTPVAFPQLLA